MIMFIVARAFCGLGIGAFDTLMKIVVAGKNIDRKNDTEPGWGWLGSQNSLAFGV
jgi:hypothetical protein